ncbi:hypothetical protein [Nostoc sp.]
MPKTSLREAAPTTSLLLFLGCANGAAQYKSVQVPNAQCPIPRI